MHGAFSHELWKRKKERISRIVWELWNRLPIGITSSHNLEAFRSKPLRPFFVMKFLIVIYLFSCYLFIMLNFHWQYYCLWFFSFYFVFNKPQRFAYFDASASGCGSVIILNEDCVCHKLWEPWECSRSSTWRACSHCFCSRVFAPILEGSLVKWFPDSKTAARNGISGVWVYTN